MTRIDDFRNYVGRKKCNHPQRKFEDELLFKLVAITEASKILEFLIN